MTTPTRPICKEIARENWNAALEKAARWHDRQRKYYPKMAKKLIESKNRAPCWDFYRLAIEHKFSAVSIRNFKIRD